MVDLTLNCFELENILEATRTKIHELEFMLTKGAGEKEEVVAEIDLLHLDLDEINEELIQRKYN